ncbi:glucose 1-dehydrogenase [Niallia oryzisoli]|uniref:Glucose 1-dehydrogenase n=1 Tax=Niallia oryzisoli TaxID=1737571 RepID=A0ABZ2C7H3_9BACI
MRLREKVALITGGASGLGRETAILFAKEGAKVVITDINEEMAKEVIEIIQSNDGEALFIKHDVAVEEEWKSVIQTTLQTYDKLNVVVNCAGIGTFATIEDTTFELWHKVISINLDGPFLGTKYGIEAMKKTGQRGSIINVSSIASMVGDPGLVAYGASKGGVDQLSKSAALYCAKEGLNIRVNTVHPAYIQTPLMANVEDVEYVKSLLPVGHFGEPIDVANGILYLASDESKFTTGSQLLIDGGYCAQ